MTPEEIQILSSMATSNQEGMLFLQEGEEQAILHLPHGDPATRHVSPATVLGVISKGWVAVSAAGAGRLTPSGLEAVKAALLPDLKVAWEKRIVLGVSGRAFYPFNLARREANSATTDAFVALGWIQLEEGIQPFRFADAAQQALGIERPRVPTPEEVAEQRRAAQAERDRIAMEERRRAARAAEIREAEADVLGKARAVVHGDGRSGQLDQLRSALAALEMLETADQLASDLADAGATAHTPSGPR